MSQILKCAICDYTEPVPMHCRQSMRLELIDGKEQLVCWMGPSCGVQDIPTHCGKPMILEEGDSPERVDSPELEDGGKSSSFKEKEDPLSGSSSLKNVNLSITRRKNKNKPQWYDLCLLCSFCGEKVK